MRRRSKTSWAVGVIAPWFLGVGVLVSFTAVAGQDAANDWNVAPLTARLQAAGRPAALGNPLTGDIGLYGQAPALARTASLTIGEPGDFRSIPDEREPHVDLKPSARNFPEVDRTRKGDPVVEMRPSFESRRISPEALGFAAPPQLSFHADGAVTRVMLAPRAVLPAESALDRAAFRRNRLNAENVIDSKSVERALGEKPVPTFSQRALAPAAAAAPPAAPASENPQDTTQKGTATASPAQSASAATPAATDAMRERIVHGATPQVSRAVALGSSTPAQPDATPIEVSSFPRAALALATPGEPEDAARPDYAAMIEQDKMDREKRCLAEAVYFESRSEPEAGQAAVAQVVLNRVQSGLYPSSVCGVVYQNRAHYHRCQFSFACEGKSLRITERESWERAVRVANEVMAGRTYLTDVGLSTHYHANYVKPRWARSLTKMDVIGRHIFYKLKPGQT